MLLKWLEVDELGETHVRENSPINVRNVHEYAKRNCRRCHGRGTENVDSGQSGDRTRYNPRIVACDCVLVNLQRIENARTGN